jgi:hypothetical protein
MNSKVSKAIRRHGLGSAAHAWYAGAHWGRLELRRMSVAAEAIRLEIQTAVNVPKGTR